MHLSDADDATQPRVDLSAPGWPPRSARRERRADRACSPPLSHATGVGFVLESYEVHSMGDGLPDARGEITLSGRIDGETMSGQGTSRDVLASDVWLDVANRCACARRSRVETA